MTGTLVHDEGLGLLGSGRELRGLEGLQEFDLKIRNKSPKENIRGRKKRWRVRKEGESGKRGVRVAIGQSKGSVVNWATIFGRNI